MTSRFLLSGRGIAIVLLFVIFTVGIVLFNRNQAVEPAYDPDGRGAQGLLLWRAWLTEMGFSVETTGRTTFDLPDAAAVLYVYPGIEEFTSDEADQLLAWVEAGGTLVLVGVQDSRIQQRFGYEMREADVFSSSGIARQTQPLLPAGPATWFGPGPVPLPHAGDTAAPVLSLANNTATVTVQQQGAGVVWLLPTRYAFTNNNLLEDELPHLLLATLRGVPDRATIVLDTYHLFGPSLLAGSRIRTVQDWLYGTPSGWASLFLLALAVLFLLLSGRRLGPAVVVPAQGRRREAAEYVVAMAGLQRRADVSDSIARHHRRRLRLALGRRHRIPADLDDAEFLRRLRNADTHIDEDTMARMHRILEELAALPRSDKLVDLVAEADEVLSERKMK